MKKEIEIKFKIAVHEKKVNKILAIDREDWNDSHCELIRGYLRGRLALQWVLSPDQRIEKDDFEKHALFECICHESSKIF